MTIQNILEKTTGFFREKGIDSPRLDAELLLAGALGLKRIDLYLKFDQPVSEEELVKCREFVRRRSHGEPVAYILEKKEFYGLEFYVNRHVLVPRPETETLVENALNRLGDREARIIDLGCGSGCIGLTILKNRPRAKGVLLDASAEALEVARRNAETLGLSERTEFFHGKVEELFTEASKDSFFDLVAANPPYITPEDPRLEASVRTHEPHLALFAEDGGWSAINEWSKVALKLLIPGGWFLVEVGADQGPRTAHHFQNLNFSEIQVLQDLSGHDRIVVGQKPVTAREEAAPRDMEDNHG